VLNWAALLGYLAAMVGIGVWCSRGEESTDQFFLAGKKIPWWAAGLSIFGTQLSAITFMAIPATAFAEDWVRMIGNLMIMPVIPVIVLLFLPFFRRLNITTAYEYLERRFNVAVRVLASLLFILFQLGRMGVVLYLPAIALSAVTGLNVYLCIALMGVLATIYTVMGGIEAVIWTDVVQVLVLLGGALICVMIAAIDGGGFGELVATGMRSNKMNLLVWDWSPASFGVWVMVVGGFFTALVPYSTDQTVVQRYLTTKDERQAAGSLWLNFAMTLPAALIFYGLGTALFVFYTNNPELALPAKADRIVPWFVIRELPDGVAGMVIAGIFAAAMSSLDSSMNSVATAYVNDFHRRFRPSSDDRQSLRLAKGVTVTVGSAGTAIAIWMATQDIEYLFDFFNQLVGLFGGSLSGVFLLAVLTRRGSSAGALVGLAAGAAATLAVAFATDTNFYLYAAIGCLTCLGVGYVVSLFAPNTKSTAGLNIHEPSNVERVAHAVPPKSQTAQ
jgi:SSS family transporter